MSRKFNPYRAWAHDGKALRQWKDIPTVIWQTCRICQQNYKVSEMTFVENECESCRAKQARTFAYISEDDGREHAARSLDWDTLLDTMPHIQDDPVLNVLDDESVAAVASMQTAIAALRVWRDETCVGVLAPRIIASCTCPVCIAIRSLEVAIANIYSIFE